MTLSIVLFILKIIFLYIILPCVILASIVSSIYIFLIVSNKKKNKDMVKATVETMYYDKENRNRRIYNGEKIKKLHIHGITEPDKIINLNDDIDDEIYIFNNDGKMCRFAGGQDIYWQGSHNLIGQLSFIGTISEETYNNWRFLCNFEKGDVVHVQDLNKMFIYNGTDLIEIEHDYESIVTAEKNRLKTMLENAKNVDNNFEESKENDVLDNLNEDLDKLISEDINE